VSPKAPDLGVDARSRLCAVRAQFVDAFKQVARRYGACSRAAPMRAIVIACSLPLIVGFLLLAGCGGYSYRFMSLDAPAMARRPHVELVAFDAFDWYQGIFRSIAPGDPRLVSQTLAPEVARLVDGLSRSGFAVTRSQVKGDCNGDLTGVCDQVPAPAMTPLNLSARAAQDLAEAGGARLLLEVHLLHDAYVHGHPVLSSRGNPTLLVRAWDGAGRVAWEDQQGLVIPLAVGDDARARVYGVAIGDAIDTLVARLASRLPSPG
jgi:hypothetical protein